MDPSGSTTIKNLRRALEFDMSNINTPQAEHERKSPSPSTISKDWKTPTKDEGYPSFRNMRSLALKWIKNEESLQKSTHKSKKMNGGPFGSCMKIPTARTWGLGKDTESAKVWEKRVRFCIRRALGRRQEPRRTKAGGDVYEKCRASRGCREGT